MTLKPPTRTFPKLVMKEWPMTCSWCGTNAEEAAARHEGPHSTWCVHFRESQRWEISSKALSDFTRVVEETGILDQEEAHRTKQESKHD